MKNYKNFDIEKSTLIILFLSFLIVSSKLNSSGQYAYHPPENINDGLVAGSLDEANIDVKLIEKGVNKIHQGGYKEVHSLLIFKDNKLVFEEYFDGHSYKWEATRHHGDWQSWDKTIPHDIKSVTKSITSTCIEIAIDHGFIQSVHQSIFDYLPDHQHLKTGGRDKITIEHLLTMTSGLEWPEWSAPYSSVANPCLGIWYQDKDPVSYILEKPMVNEPGQHFNYSSGNTIILGEIIKHSTNMLIDEFSKTYLFEPLMIDSSYWSIHYDNGVIEAAGSLELTPRAMLKIGILFLNKGAWEGNQIISEKWIEKSAVSFAGNNGINIPGVGSGRNGYSYSWWTNSVFHSGKFYDLFSAGGWGGQEIMVFPQIKTVVVFTGGNYLSKTPPFKILKRYIIPAID